MKTLLLNSNYTPLAFHSEMKSIKLIMNDKVDVLSSWDSYIYWTCGKIKIPSIIRMKYLVKNNFPQVKFSKDNLFKRDKFTCQYCGGRFFVSSLTNDHIHPKMLGGQNAWLNCTTSCWKCNNKKGSKTLEEAGMVLLNKPFIPRSQVVLDYNSMKYSEKHPDWEIYMPR